MKRVLSGIQSTGETHLGNYLGAIRNWVSMQHESDAFYFIPDLHSLTSPREAADLATRTLNMATMLLAAGLDPDVCTLFVQSHVPQHSQLAWLMECNVSIGELQRMTQFKDKSARQTGELIPAGLLTYPALQAADILLYDTDQVPVGDDQRQHIEITRDIAERFNSRYGQTFVVPEAVIPKAGARVMDLQEPTNKMSKSADSPQGTVLVLDPPEVIERKFKRAVTDSDPEVRYDRATKPGVSNLLDILAACSGEAPDTIAARYSQYGPLKADTAAAVIELLRPVRERYEALAADPGHTAKLLARGAEKAESIASVTLARAQRNIGLLPPA
jgi:tryptophanyl-tRNA synthetase